MSDRQHRRSSRRRLQEPSSPGRSTQHEPARRQSWAGKSPKEILARYKPGRAPPLTVLDILIDWSSLDHRAWVPGFLVGAQAALDDYLRS